MFAAATGRLVSQYMTCFLIAKTCLPLGATLLCQLANISWQSVWKNYSQVRHGVPSCRFGVPTATWHCTAKRQNSGKQQNQCAFARGVLAWLDCDVKSFGCHALATKPLLSCPSRLVQ